MSNPRALLLVLSLTVGGCNSATKVEPGDVDQTFTAQMASQTLAVALPNLDDAQVAAVCGPSAGKGLYENDGLQEFQADGIGGGRTVFILATDGSAANVIFRDAGGQYLDAKAEGAEVRIVDVGRRVWTVAYPSTGVVETFNFVSQGSALVLLQTVNKPQGLAVGPSARIFTSKCFRP